MMHSKVLWTPVSSIFYAFLFPAPVVRNRDSHYSCITHAIIQCYYTQYLHNDSMKIGCPAGSFATFQGLEYANNDFYGICLTNIRADGKSILSGIDFRS